MRRQGVRSHTSQTRGSAATLADNALSVAEGDHDRHRPSASHLGPHAGRDRLRGAAEGLLGPSGDGGMIPGGQSPYQWPVSGRLRGCPIVPTP
jgi:hypothetical protein